MHLGFKGLFIAALAAGLMTTTPGQAIHLNQGDIVRMDFTFSNAPPYQTSQLLMNFFGVDEFGPHETLQLEIFDANDDLLESKTRVAQGNQVLSTADTFSPTLDTISYYVFLTAVVGSFDLTAAIGTVGSFSNGFGHERVDGELRYEFQAAPVPGPVVGAGLPSLVMSLGGFLAWRRQRKALAA